MSLLVKTNSTQGYHKPELREGGKAVFRVEYADDDTCLMTVEKME